ncbi:alpha-(1-_3)-arabinofuranosyltransferase [Planobispora takensis]|uniref:Coagulation factor 5/8 type n=1 Tax=Planobispora takensis TaxID=1367882 RepID=A0A8J3SWN0_9ACTN|nr:alpha-(1->3)-arabinofuranosyltransferase [Planobispora takensis]GII01011.1 coagulation factor 5/8 type [Planobispora takensis]
MTFDAWNRPRTAHPAESESSRLRGWIQQLAGCLLLGAIAFNTAPDRIIAETKLDMAINPLGFLSRATHLWDGTFFGHLQNQAHGYLFPMGPFYSLWLALDMPAWNVQRLWMSVVLIVAFLGVVRVVRELGAGSSGAGILAGLAYALAPHAQALIGVNSSEFLPSAILPWILLPLIRGASGRTTPRRAAALSAAALLLCGGVNAAAELAVLVVPLLYLLTRQGGPLKRRLLAWWLPLVGMAAFWWLAPLLVMGRHIFSFLPFIETASATSGVTSLTNVVRGTSSWLSFLQTDGRPWVEASFAQATTPWLIVVTSLVAALGLAGLARRSTPERLFLVLTLLVGVIIVSAGHAGPLAGFVRELLDGPLAPFRNLHKFDALIRLPLAVGLAALVSARVRMRVPLRVTAVALSGLSLTPVALSGVSPGGSFWEVPAYWREAVTWLNTNASDQMVLVVPGSRRGEYDWGRPIDEPLQPLLSGARWAAHTNVPWGSPGISRLLQALDERFSAGKGSLGLGSTLRRMGVGYLLVRNDLDRATIGDAWPARVHEALDESPGLSRVRGFGRQVGQEQSNIAGAWFDQPYDALEVYKVAGAPEKAGTLPAERTTRVTGGSEAVLTLAEEGLLGDDRPVVIGDDPAAYPVSGAHTVVTDTLRRRENVFSDLRRSASATLTESERPVRSAAADVTDPAWTPYTSEAEYTGIAGLSASSAESSASALPGMRDPGRQPFAAVDGDERTSWRSDGWNDPVGEWWEIRFIEPIAVPRITVRFERSAIGPRVTEAAVETDSGRSVSAITSADEQVLTGPAGTTSRLRIRITAVEGARSGRVGLSEVTIPGTRAGRTISVPDVRGGHGETMVLARTDDLSPCMRGSYAWTCDDRLGIQGEDGYGFDRRVVSPEIGDWDITGRAVLTDPKTAQQLVTLPDSYPKVTASSTIADHPAVLGRAAFDGDNRTIWYADPLDRRPTLTVDLGRTMQVSQLKLRFPDSYLGLPPVRVTVRNERGVARSGWPGSGGWLQLAPVRAKVLTLEFETAASRPLELVDVSIPGVGGVPDLESFPLQLPCGYGPMLTVGGNEVPTEIVEGTLGDVLNGREVVYRACTRVSVGLGGIRVTAGHEDPFRVRSVVIRGSRDEESDVVTMQPVEIERWDASTRQVRVATSAVSYFVVNENFNSGWKATLGGRELTAVRLDGWRQAWLLPARASGTVTMHYVPDDHYRASLLAGAVLALIVVVQALWPVRGRPGRPAARPAAPRVAVLVMPVLGFWVLGLPGAVVASLGCLLTVWAQRVAGAEHLADGWISRIAGVVRSPLVPAGFFALAGVTLAAGLPDWTGQWAALAALSTLASGLRPTPLRHNLGRPASARAVAVPDSGSTPEYSWI